MEIRGEGDKSFARLTPDEVFPYPTESPEDYYERMRGMAMGLAAIVAQRGLGKQPEQVTRDVAESRKALARTMAEEIMSDRINEAGDKDPTKKESRYSVGKEMTSASSFILDGAKSIVYGPRQHMYGHASVNFDRTAQMWEPIFGTPVNKLQVGLAMILLKVARGGNLVQREAEGGPAATFDEIEDTMKDIAGYAEATMRSMFETPDGTRIKK